MLDVLIRIPVYSKSLSQKRSLAHQDDSHKVNYLKLYSVLVT